MSTANGHQPIFDFSHYSHKQAKANELNGLRLVRLVNQARNPDAFATEEEFEAALARVADLLALLEQQLSFVLVDVPRAWLIEGAPADLDWSDPASQEWVREDKMETLRECMNDARQPESVTKK
jgi:hypothetical protein